MRDNSNSTDTHTTKKRKNLGSSSEENPDKNKVEEKSKSTVHSKESFLDPRGACSTPVATEIKRSFKVASSGFLTSSSCPHPLLPEKKVVWFEKVSVRILGCF
ncbi:hypothetical protein JTE90_022310 [Oedothorax gibbosus]|uniref:Uncharacterized protein n=1 Tax=Oedothorax gibbosus TaxID=931172 RepID=A0AAV6VX57_9ARAC|nr:hypothetical protein JTE90_022310 [Oedothorax gibbosus]